MATNPTHAAELLSYLRMVRRVRMTRPGPVHKGFCGTEDVVFRHGRLWQGADIQPLPATLRRGEIKQCFANSQRLVMEDTSLTYVEGYALSIIPVHHAWCVTPEGTVVDPTWERPGGVYAGVPVKYEYILRITTETGWWTALFDNWQSDPPQPILSGDHPVEDWLGVCAGGEPLC